MYGYYRLEKLGDCIFIPTGQGLRFDWNHRARWQVCDVGHGPKTANFGYHLFAGGVIQYLIKVHFFLALTPYLFGPLWPNFHFDNWLIKVTPFALPGRLCNAD